MFFWALNHPSWHYKTKLSFITDLKLMWRYLVAFVEHCQWYVFLILGWDASSYVRGSLRLVETREFFWWKLTQHVWHVKHLINLLDVSCVLITWAVCISFGSTFMEFYVSEVCEWKRNDLYVHSIHGTVLHVALTLTTFFYHAYTYKWWSFMSL